MSIQGRMVVFWLLLALGSSASAELTTTNITPRWQQRDYQILPNSVCYNYKLRSVEYRRCRRLAKQQFKQRCVDYRVKSNNTQYPYNREYVLKQQMYCYAALTFNPLRY